MSKGYKLIVTGIITGLVLLNILILLKTFMKEPDAEDSYFRLLSA